MPASTRKEAATFYGMVQLQQYSADTDITVRRSLCLCWEGGMKKSRQYKLEMVLARGYTNAELWYLLGVVLFLSGSMKHASEAFLEMIHLNQSECFGLVHERMC